MATIKKVTKKVTITYNTKHENIGDFKDVSLRLSNIVDPI